MALDGVTLAHLISELAPQIIGARIDKVQQPEKEEILLILRHPGQSLRLLINVSATAARLHLTQESKKNPATPPMFCMILRKHLEGGKILKIEQLGLERIVRLTIQNYNEYGDLADLHLHLEIMGKHSNLLLVDPQSNTILDGLKRYSHALSRYREVLPGRPYLTPPSQNKLEPVTDEDTWRQYIFKEDWDSKLTDILLKRFAGISPELAREIVLRSGLDSETRLNQCGEIDLSRLFQAYSLLGNPSALSQVEPCLYFTTGTRSGSENLVPTAFTFLPFQQYLGFSVERTTSLNEAIERFYTLRSKSNALEAKRGSLRKVVQDQISHLSKKLNIYEETLLSAEKGLAYQKWGELLTANLYRITQGAKEITLEDYTEETLPPITIPLDPLLSGLENAQRYFRLYNKAKATLQKTATLKQDTLKELEYLESVLLSLEQASNPAELDEVYKELIEQGYIAGKSSGKEESRNKKGAKADLPKPKIYYSSTGRQILVGKNNRQNDWLTLKKGRPHDLWLHVKNIPGSHVLIPLNEGEDFPDDTTLEEAAALAIHFSQARGSSLVPVDYTHVKNIKKPNAAKPGMVVYEKNWTLYLTPDQEVLTRLLISEETTTA